MQQPFSLFLLPHTSLSHIDLTPITTTGGTIPPTLRSSESHAKQAPPNIVEPPPTCRLKAPVAVVLEFWCLLRADNPILSSDSLKHGLHVLFLWGANIDCVLSCRFLMFSSDQSKNFAIASAIASGKRCRHGRRRERWVAALGEERDGFFNLSP